MSARVMDMGKTNTNANTTAQSIQMRQNQYQISQPAISKNDVELNMQITQEIKSIVIRKTEQKWYRWFTVACIFMLMVGTPTARAEPSSLIATTISSGQINLAWTDSDTALDYMNGAGYYSIERKTGSGGTWSTIGTIYNAAYANSSTPSYYDTGLTSGTTYYYRVYGHYDYPEMGTEGYGNEASATTTAVTLTAPSGLSATAASGTVINLSWTDNSSNETGFKIERKLSSAGTWTQIGTTGANTNSYSDTGLASSTGYTYRIRAYDSGSTNSSYSNEASATTSSLPAAPSGLSVNSSGVLSWTDNSSDETGFKIERKVGNGGFAKIATVAANATSFTDTQYAGGIKYTYRISATNANGDSSFSNEASVGSLASSGLRNLSATSGTGIALTWDDDDLALSYIIGGGGSFGYYQVQRKTGISGTWSTLATVYEISYNDTSAVAGTTYYYRIYGHYEDGALGTDGYSNTTVAIAPGIPFAPSSLGLTLSSATQITLAWTDNSGNEDAFKIERKAGSGGTWAQIATTATNITTLQDSGLTSGTTYYYRVRASNDSGNSAYSAENNATTIAAPGAPTIGSATSTVSQQATVTFTAPSSNGGSAITGYTVTSSPAGGTDSNAGTTGLSHVVTGLTNGTAYTFTVTATNAAGTGVASAASNSVTPPVPPLVVYYIYTDHLDTPREVTDTSGNVRWRWDNADPFGNNAPDENPASLGAFSFNLRFPGQYADGETNTYYNVNRDYDPAIGRYIQSDPIGLAGGINTYGYVGGNPISQSDSLGLLTACEMNWLNSNYGYLGGFLTDLFNVQQYNPWDSHGDTGNLKENLKTGVEVGAEKLALTKGVGAAGKLMGGAIAKGAAIYAGAASGTLEVVGAAVTPFATTALSLARDKCKGCDQK